MDSNFEALGAHYVKPSCDVESTHQRDAALLSQLLTTVDDSVSSFKPSPSLADLRRPAGKMEEIDIVVSGGGLKGYFLIGARHVLERQLSSRGLAVRRFAGASAGAFSAMFMAIGLTSADWLKTYTFTRMAMEAGHSSRVLEAYREQILPWLCNQLPADAYKRCSGRCFISITVLGDGRSGWIPHNIIVSEYTSNEDLLNACFASSCIPFVVERTLGPRFRGMRVIDGGLTNNTPTFGDGARRQLVIRLEHVPYDLFATAFPSDPCIESLALSGALLMARFLEGRDCGPAISWHSPVAAPHPLARLVGKRGTWALLAAAALVVLHLSRRRRARDSRALSISAVALGLAALAWQRDRRCPGGGVEPRDRDDI